jgi:hypothetical protein
MRIGVLVALAGLVDRRMKRRNACAARVIHREEAEMDRNQPITRQFVRAAMVAMILTVVTAARAQAGVVQTSYVKVLGGVADFGSGTHLFGSPSGNAVVTYSLDASSGSLIVTGRVQGTFYWDSLDPGCTFIDIEFSDDNPFDLVPLSIHTASSPEFCAPGGDANLAANKLTIDERFSRGDLHSVTIRLSQERGGFIRDIARETVPFTLFNQNKSNVTINGGTADFGTGLHVSGTPTGSGQVEFGTGLFCPEGFTRCGYDIRDPVRPVHGITASVYGVLYWDSLFDKGCARLQIQFQDASGNGHGTRDRDKCGPGGNANNSDNKRLIDEFKLTTPELFKVRLRTGTVLSDGSFVNTTTRTFSIVGEVGHFELAPVAAIVRVREPLNYELTWTVPEPLTWHDLQALQVRIRGNAGTVLWLRWDEASNTFAVFNEETGEFGHAVRAGSPRRLETRHATLDVAQSSVAAVESVLGSGATSPSILLKLALSFKPSAIGGPYRVEVAAANDLGNEDPFMQAGTLTVTPRELAVGLGLGIPVEASVHASEETSYGVQWTVPEPESWHSLDTLLVRLVDVEDEREILQVRFDEASNSFSRFHPHLDRFGPPVQPGSHIRFESPDVALLLRDTEVIGTGETGPSVVLNLALQFKPGAAGHIFAVQMKAADDSGNVQGWDQVGSILVHHARHGRHP